MRIRHKPYAKAELAAWSRFNTHPENSFAHWFAEYQNPDLPFHVELGCGKGRFLAQLALREPGVNYLGVDIKNEVLVVAKRTIEKSFENIQKKPNNVMLTSYNVEKIHAILGEHDEVARIYINFCNPWYKAGHAKHRLTHPRQLVQYRRFLRPGAEIHFKTDDEPLFRDSLRYFPMAGFEIQWQCFDLHKEGPGGNIPTEHEEMFARQGIPIKACVAKMVPAQLDIERLSLLKDI